MDWISGKNWKEENIIKLSSFRNHTQEEFMNEQFPHSYTHFTKASILERIISHYLLIKFIMNLNCFEVLYEINYLIY